MNKKKAARLRLMFLVVVLLGLAYAAEDHFLTVLGREKKMKEAAKEQDMIRLAIPEEEIARIRFAGGDGEVVLEHGTEGWTSPDSAYFAMDPAAAARLCKDLGGLKAERVLTGEGDLSGFGLDPPRQTVDIALKDGQEISLYIGDRNDSSHELYAATSLDRDAVFLTRTALDEHFAGTLRDLALYEEIPALQAEKIRRVRVEREDESFELTTPGDDTCTVTDRDGEVQDADLSATGRVLYQLADLNWLKNLEYDAKEPEIKAKYGLDSPACTVTVFTEGPDGAEETALTLLTGGKDENGNDYVQLAGSRQVHSIRHEYLASLTEGSARDFWSLSYSFVSLSDLDHLEVHSDGRTLTLVRTAEDGQQDDAHVTWLVNGQEVSKESFTDFYYACASVTAEERVSPVPHYTEEPALELIYYVKDGSTKQMQYYPADQNYYTVIYEDGSRAASVNRLYVRNMLDALNTLYNFLT